MPTYKFLIDSDVISNLMKERPTQPAEDWFYGLAEDGFAIPQTAVFEKYRGFEILAATAPGDAKVLDEWFEGFLSTLGPDQVVVPDNRTLRLLARMWSEPRLKNFIFNKEGTKKAKTGGDLVIAATAITHGMPVATFNVADFEVINRLFALPGLYHPGRDEWVIPFATPALSAAPEPGRPALTAGLYAVLSRRKAFRNDPAGSRIGLLTEIARKAGIVLTDPQRAILFAAYEPERLDELGTVLLNAGSREEAHRHLEECLASIVRPPGP